MAETPPLITSASFGVLDETQAKQVRDFSYPSHPCPLTSIAREFSIRKTKPSSATVVFYTDTLLKTNPAMLNWMNDSDLEALNEDLILAYYHLCDRYQSNFNESRRQNLAQYYKDIKKAASLISNVNLAIAKQSVSAPEINDDKKGLFNFLFDAEMNFFSGITVYIRKRMGDFNYWRLYWVWTGILLRTSLSMMSDTFENIQQTKYVATEFQNIWGYISWTLYFARLSINMALVLKHTIPCQFWMSKEERDMVKEQGMRARFADQMKARKFGIANDFIWGLVNMVCHLKWYGPGILGYAGNVATAILLVGDLLLTMQRRAEEKAEHEHNLSEYKAQIDSLTKKINELEPSPANRPKLLAQLIRLQDAHYQCILNWKHKERGTNADRTFAAGMLTSFVILCSCLIPDGVLSATAFTALGLSGAGLLFMAAFAYTVYKAYMEVAKAQDTELRALLDCQSILANPVKNQLNYLRYKQLEAEIEYQQQLAQHQFYKLARSFIVEALIPIVIFSAFTFLSFGLATAVMAVGFMIAVVSNQVIDYYKPSGPELVNLGKEKDFSLEGKRAEIEEKIERARPSKRLEWFFHSPEELGDLKAQYCPSVSLG